MTPDKELDKEFKEAWVRSAKGKPGARRLSRALTMMLLYHHDLNPAGPGEVMALFEKHWAPLQDEERSLNISPQDYEKAWPLAKTLFSGICKHLPQLDEGIAKASANWAVYRMSPVDRALIRLAYYEMLYRDDIPPAVSLNEALELAKDYGDGDSRSFINGVLDKLLKLSAAAGKEADDEGAE